MSKAEFVAVLRYITAAVGKELADDPEAVKNRLRVYYDLLGDLEPGVFLAAAKAALLESTFPVIPPVGTLRQHAVRIMQGQEVEAAEAWALVLHVQKAPGGKYRERLKEKLPARARQAADLIGWETIGASTDKIGSKLLFEQTYKSMAAREEREQLLPPSARELIEGAFQMPALPAPSQAGGKLFHE